MYETIILIVSVFFFFQSQVILNHLATLSAKLTHYLFDNVRKPFGGMLFIIKSLSRLLVRLFKVIYNRKKLPSTEQHWLKIKL